MRNWIDNISGKLTAFAGSIEPKHLWIAVLVSIVIKCLLSIFFMNKFPSVEDWTIATNLVAGNGYTYIQSVGETAMKMPVYPLFLSVFISIFGESKIFPVLAQHILMSVTAVGIFRVGEFFFSKKVSLWLGILFLVHPSFFYYSNTLEVTNLFVPVFVLATYQFLRYRKHVSAQSPKLMISCIVLGVLCSVLVQLQPVVLPALLAAIVYLLFKKRIRHVAIISATALLLLAPWTVRNYYTFGRFMPLKSPVWMNFYLGYWQNTPRYTMISDSLHRQLFDGDVQRYNDIDMEPRYRAIVYPIIMNDIPLYIEKTFCQAYMYWTYPPRYSDDRSLSFLLARKLPNAILGVAFALSLVVAFKRNRAFFYSCVFVFAYFTAVYAATSVHNIRYKLDIEWIELISLGFLFSGSFCRVMRKNNSAPASE